MKQTLIKFLPFILGAIIIIGGYFLFDIHKKYNALEKSHNVLIEERLQEIEDNETSIDSLRKEVEKRNDTIAMHRERDKAFARIIDSLENNRYDQDIDDIPSSDSERIHELFSRYYD